jgi:hypothetical protein
MAALHPESSDAQAEKAVRDRVTDMKRVLARDPADRLYAFYWLADNHPGVFCAMLAALPEPARDT